MQNQVQNSEELNSQKTFLSVVIPAKNEAQFIERCLEHVKKAIEFWSGDAEIILVDNGSSDQTVILAESKGAKVIVEKTGTISHLRNAGAKKANGEVIAFLDADCLVAPEWITYCLEKLEEFNVSGVGTRAMPDLDNATWVEKTVSSLMAGADRPDYVKWLGTSNLFIKYSVFWSVGGFDETMITAEDVNLCNKLNGSGLFYLEKRVDTIHLRESKNLTDLFKREFWRGRNSLESYVKGGFESSEFLSVAAPLINLFCLIMILFLSVIKINLAGFFSVIFILFPLMYVLKKFKTISFSTHFVKAYIVSCVFLMARSVAAGNEIMLFLKRQIKK